MSAGFHVLGSSVRFCGSSCALSPDASFVSVMSLPKLETPLVQRTNGVVVPPAGSAPGRLAHRELDLLRCPLGALSGASRSARGRRSRRRAHAARTVPRSLRAVSALLFPVLAVSRGV